MAFFVAADTEVLSTAVPGRFLGLLNDTDNGNRSAHDFPVELDAIFNAEFGDGNNKPRRCGRLQPQFLISRHLVLGWSFVLDGTAPSLNIARLPALPPAWPKPRSKLLEIVLPIASAVLVLAVGAVIYTFAATGQVRRAARGLGWPQRFNIIRGLESGLLYLHEDWEQGSSSIEMLRQATCY
jgi:hypothetical protein